MRIRIGLALLLLCTGALALLAGVAQAQEGSTGAPVVDVLEIDRAIGPVSLGYLERALDDAEATGADLVVLRLNTPGGSVAITERILSRMQNADVPVVVWVGPRGAMAASAGTFIVLAGHVAAMAPETTIGAASPIDASGKDMNETSQAKAMNMLAARVRTLARRRGTRAEDWAVSAVRDAAAITETEALDLGVIDLVSDDLTELLERLDGRQVQIRGMPHMLNTAGATTRDVEMRWREGILDAITSPNVAFILLSLGLAGLGYELMNPGFGFSGVIGAICLLLGLYAMGTLPVNYAGLGLLAVSFLLFIADVKVGSGGLLALGGAVAMVLGGIMLFNSPEAAVSWYVLAATAGSMALFFAFAANAAYRALGRRSPTGREGLVGVHGVVLTAIEPGATGIVRLSGERWRAEANEPLPAGTNVEVEAVENLRLRVRRAGGVEPAKED